MDGEHQQLPGCIWRFYTNNIPANHDHHAFTLIRAVKNREDKSKDILHDITVINPIFGHHANTAIKTHSWRIIWEWPHRGRMRIFQTHKFLLPIGPYNMRARPSVGNLFEGKVTLAQIQRIKGHTATKATLRTVHACSCIFLSHIRGYCISWKFFLAFAS